MSAPRTPDFALRPMLPADGPRLAEIFRASIAGLTGDDYSESQQAAWASTADDEQAFGARLSRELTLIAVELGEPVGFASLRGADQINMLYVHPTVAGRGAGSMLCDALEKLAGSRGATRLVTDASDSARDFFEHRGYVAQQRNTVTCGGEWLANTTMEKKLTRQGTP